MTACEVVLPLSIPGTFSYRIPESLLGMIEPGMRVLVPFGGRKIYTGLVFSISDNFESEQPLKELISRLDPQPLLPSKQMEFWRFISEYYLVSLGDIYRYSFPGSLKLESETYLKLKEGSVIDFGLLDSNEMLLIQALEVRQVVSVSEAQAFIPKKELVKTINSLIDLQYIIIDERIHETYKPKKVLYVRIAPSVDKEKQLTESLVKLKRAPMQRELFLEVIAFELENPETPLRKSELMKDERFGASHFNGLKNKGLVEEYEVEQDRNQGYDGELIEVPELSLLQKQASGMISEAMEENKNVLLHGVTGSGKTHLYIEQMLEKIQQGHKVLFMVPEVGLNTQITSRLEKIFGSKLGYYHPRLSDFEKVEVWKKVRSGLLDVVIGTRTSLFLPFESLGLIIVDEEHDSSYKNSNQSLHFQARDSALMLGKFHQAPVLLGSATPSVESYFQCLKGKLNYVPLFERFEGVDLPQFTLLNFKEAIDRKEVEADFTLESKAKMEEVLQNKKQVMVLHNRRGYSSVVECESCGHVTYCSNCDVVMTYHKGAAELKCHYCGHRSAMPVSCPKCHSQNLSTKGVGVEQMHEQVEKLFPQYQSDRMDVDSMRKKFAYEKLFERIGQGETDILVGTQMISKGLDFDHIELVVVPRADHLLHVQDYRAEEKAYQLLTQLAGRAGRVSGKGEVYIQSFQPSHRIFQLLKEENPSEIYNYLLNERRKFHYPPFTKTVLIELRHRKEDRVERSSRYLGSLLRNYLPQECVLGPEKAHIGRINLLYQYQILLKFPRGKKYAEFKGYLKKSLGEFQQISAYRSVKIDVTVDF